MRRLLLVGALAGLPGCPTNEPPPACLTPPANTMCDPLYTPDSFTKVYSNTVRFGCGSTMGSCHSASGRAGGLSFETEQKAYEELVIGGRVKPGDPSCSEFIVRVDSPGADYQMPPGDPLSPEERCALIKWVEMGAPQ